MVTVKQNILTSKSGGEFDFEWVFEKNTELKVIDPRYKSLLMEMYKQSTTPFLVLREDEKYLLKKYKFAGSEKIEKYNEFNQA
jgi:hypothetical protein